MTETSFFRLIGGSACNDEIQESYNGFISEVVSLCSNMSNPENTFFALSFAETELQFHDTLQTENTGNSRASMYARHYPLYARCWNISVRSVADRCIRHRWNVEKRKRTASPCNGQAMP